MTQDQQPAAFSFGRLTGTWALDVSAQTVHLPGFFLARPESFSLSIEDLLTSIEPSDRLRLENALYDIEKGYTVLDVTVGVKQGAQGIRFFQLHGEVSGTCHTIAGVVHDVTHSHRLSRTLTELHHLAARTNVHIDNKINHILEMGLSYFGMQLAILSEVDKDLYTVKYSQSTGTPPPPGTEFNLGLTYCWHTLHAREPLSFHHVGQSAIKSHPCYETFKLESYIGAPVSVLGAIYGTINFSSPDVVEPWHNTDMDLIRLLAQWVGFELERHLTQERLNSEVEKSRANEKTKTEFLANMSHELRTPLNAIQGHVQLLQKTALTAQQVTHMHEINTAVTGLAATANSLLELLRLESRSTSPAPAPVEIDQVLRQLARAHAAGADYKKIEFIYDIETSVPQEVICIGAYLQQALDILVGNAIKFTNEGYIQLSVTKSTFPDMPQVLHWTVKDTGPGIPDEKMDHLFEPFAQADGSYTRRYGGLGLGLALCKGLTDAMDGRIWVETREKGGAAFNLIMPYAQDADVAAVDHAHVLAEANIHMVLVGESQHICAMYDRIQIAGIPVSKVADMAAAKHNLATVPPRASSSPVREQTTVVVLDTDQMEQPVRQVLTELRSSHTRSGVRYVLCALQPYEELTQLSVDMADVVVLHVPVCPSDWMNLYRWVRLTESVVVEPAADHAGVLSEDSAPQTILLVDDSRTNRLVGEQMLRSFGYEVETAINGRDAVDKIQAADQSYSMVMMDLIMPILDGYGAVREIRADQRFAKADLPIIALSAHVTSETRTACLEAGMTDCIAKPLDRDILAPLFERYGSAKTNHDTAQDPQTETVSAAAAPNGPDQPPGEAREADLSGALDAGESDSGGSAWDILTGFDVTGALSRVNQNEDLYVMLLQELKAEYQNAPSEIRALLDRDDAKEARRIAHTIKGVAANLGADQLSRIAARTDQAITSGVDATAPLMRLEKQLAVTIHAIDHFLTQTRGASVPDGPAEAPAEVSELIDILQGLRSLAQNHDMAALPLADRLSPQALPAQAQAIQAIMDSIDQLDFAVAADNIDTLLNDLQNASAVSK